MLLEDAGISTALTITSGQKVSVSGDRSLPQAPLWGSSRFTVQDHGSLSFTYVTFETSSSFAVAGGSLRLVDMAIPAGVLASTMAELSGAPGSSLRLSEVSESHNVRWESWDGIPGDDVVDLTTNPAYIADNPTRSEILGAGDFFEVPHGRHGDVDVGDNRGDRLTTYFRAPQTGDYTFVIASDDSGELWLGLDEASLRMIASNPLWTASRQWDKFDSQTSAPQSLVAGSFYYIKALAKEATGGDNLAVGVTLPTGEELRPIPVHGYLYGAPPTEAVSS
eukprot:COSAG06_NODE_5342_length_3537_cov_39.550055_6_plen_278_part_01